MSQAKTGLTVQTMAALFAMYAKDHPDAVVQFTSSEVGGRWPEGAGKMGVFTDHQVSLVDSTRCGGGITLGVMLMKAKVTD